ncbi:hypothetical protein P2Q00_12265 [Streptomyces coacervatus]|nr:hypothetical protein [Streptomyces coacervatus]MDF2266206.1 hypothetical protein [Streptomyces coacervatus]
MTRLLTASEPPSAEAAGSSAALRSGVRTRPRSSAGTVPVAVA